MRKRVVMRILAWVLVTFLMSFCTRPTLAAKKAVKVPIIVITVKATGAYSNNGEHRINKKTPAVTIVAA